MTKPRLLALAIGGLAVLFGAAAAALDGPARWACAWISLACGLVALAYVVNRPVLLAKRDGRMVAWRALPVLPFLVAYAIAAWVRRLRRSYPHMDEVAPGLWVGARLPAAGLPSGLELVVDLTAEIPASAGLAGDPRYRNLPVLDGAAPPDVDAFLDLVAEMAAADGGVYVHCVSGRGRAPTAAAAVLIARGVARDAASALELVKKGRPAAAPTRVDVAFLERAQARLRALEPR